MSKKYVLYKTGEAIHVLCPKCKEQNEFAQDHKDNFGCLVCGNIFRLDGKEVGDHK